MCGPEARLFLTGPRIVEEVTRERVSAGELGGPGVQAANGVAHLEAPGAAEGARLVRDLLAHLPATEGGPLPLAPATDPAPGDPAEPIPPGGGSDPPPGGLLAVLRDPSARAWTLAELVAYAAWTAELTYAGAFYVQSYGVSEATVGVLLAVGSFAFLATTLRTARLAERFDRRRLIATAALLMGVMLVPVLNVTPSVWFTLALFCVMALFAGIRSTGSSVLGLAQLPGQAGTMMAGRTASAQLGYMLGAAGGGLVLALADFGTLGFVLFAGMACSAALIVRVRDPHVAPPRVGEALPAPVPD
jgi:hypothetical protein